MSAPASRWGALAEWGGDVSTHADPASRHTADLNWALMVALMALFVLVPIWIERWLPPDLDEPWGIRLMRRWEEHPIRVAVAGAALGGALGLRIRALQAPSTGSGKTLNPHGA